MHTCNNEFETEGKQKISEMKKINPTYSDHAT